MVDSTRRWPRVALSLSVTLRAQNLDEAALTLNVSRQGLFVRTSTLRPVGTMVAVVVEIASGERFQAEGVVVHIHPDPDDPGRAALDQPAGLGVFLTTTTPGWRDFCDLVERTRGGAEVGGSDR